MLAQSNLFSVSVAQYVPAWLTALTYGNVALVGSNTMESVATVQARTLTDPWIGAAVDQAARKFVIGNPGGHGDGGSNAVYEFRLNQDVPQWYRTRVGTVVGLSPDQANAAGVDGTGQPSNCHSYHRPLVANGRLWLPTLDSAASSNGWWTTTTVSYDLSQTANGVWRHHGRLTTGTIPSWIGGSACYDPVTDRIFSFPSATNSGPGYYFDVSDVLAAADVPFPGGVVGSTAINGPSFGGWVYSCSVACQALRRLVFLSESTSGGSVTLRSLQFDNLGAGWASHTVSPATLPFGPYYGGGFVFHESARRFYSYNSGGNTIRVYEVPANPANAWTMRTVTLGGLTIPAGTGSDNGSRGFSRFNIVQDMGNGDACLIWYPRHTLQGAYVVRVPAGGL